MLPVGPFARRFCYDSRIGKMKNSLLAVRLTHTFVKVKNPASLFPVLHPEWENRFFGFLFAPNFLLL
ncbi:MAG: hypothetical protein A3E80_04850 [Chlamydiae bacterium RIFCSPHIGHO2_12_FULL_49_9]|nr:MAG: hypothetical protein A3E80_04850 [Chlamydiae bacterium RIFCSPHIGHO2_12_FULL_49_9]